MKMHMKIWEIKLKCFERVTSPAHDHDLDVGRVLADLEPDVEREDGAAAVEDGGQGRHERTEHHRQHHATRTCRKCVAM